jgi:hypothetical protein
VTDLAKSVLEILNDFLENGTVQINDIKKYLYRDISFVPFEKTFMALSYLANFNSPKKSLYTDWTNNLF